MGLSHFLSVPLFFLFNIAHIFDHFYFIHLMSSPYTFHIFFISSDFWMISIFENMMIYVIAFFISNVGSSLTYVRNCFLEFAWEANLQIKYQDLQKFVGPKKETVWYIFQYSKFMKRSIIKLENSTCFQANIRLFKLIEIHSRQSPTNQLVFPEENMNLTRNFFFLNSINNLSNCFSYIIL